jgi:S-adenosylmethionine decarboxylase
MDHFIKYDGKMWAGKHLLIEVYDADNTNNGSYIKNALEAMANAIKATIVNSAFHSFDGGGVTGVLILAESHISIHTWPETRYAAIDVFTCGRCNPNDAIATLCDQFHTHTIKVTEIMRGEQVMT